jgi:hypothetical protein
MPFEGLARSVSQEHEAEAVSRQRSSSVSSRHPPVTTTASTLSRPNPVAEETASIDSTATLADEGADLEAVGGKEGKQEKMEVEAPVVDEFLVTLRGREHLSPQTWNSTYRWFLTGFAGLLVLNASESSLCSLPSCHALEIVTTSGSRDAGSSTNALSLNQPSHLPHPPILSPPSSSTTMLAARSVSCSSQVRRDPGTTTSDPILNSFLFAVFVAGYCLGPLSKFSNLECTLEAGS